MYENLPEEALGIISDVLRTKKSEIANIGVLKQGMINRSFLYLHVEIKNISFAFPEKALAFLLIASRNLMFMKP